MNAELPPGVRARAAQAARRLPWPTVSGLTADEYWLVVVDTVAGVLAAGDVDAEINRLTAALTEIASRVCIAQGARCGTFPRVSLCNSCVARAALSVDV